MLLLSWFLEKFACWISSHLNYHSIKFKYVLQIIESKNLGSHIHTDKRKPLSQRLKLTSNPMTDLVNRAEYIDEYSQAKESKHFFLPKVLDNKLFLTIEWTTWCQIYEIYISLYWNFKIVYRLKNSVGFLEPLSPR